MRRSIWLRRTELRSGRIALRSQEKPIRSRSRFSEISANSSEFYRRPGRFDGRLAPAVHRDTHRASIHRDGGPKTALNVINNGHVRLVPGADMRGSLQHLSRSYQAGRRSNPLPTSLYFTPPQSL